MEPSDEIIKLEITKPGSDKETLNVHRGVLCQSSVFFQKALKPEWATLREHPDVIELPDDSVQLVSDYIRWLYCGNIPTKLYDADKETPEKVSEAEVDKVHVMLAEAYVFGEKIIDTKYKNALMKAILAVIDDANWFLGYECVNIIYKGTPSASPLRRLVADQVAYLARERPSWSTFFDGLSKEALLDALKAMVRLRATPTDKQSGIDSYLERMNEIE